MNRVRQLAFSGTVLCVFLTAAMLIAPATANAAGGQLLNLPAPTGARFPTLTDLVWPANPGEADVCLWADDKFATFSITIDDNTAPDHQWWVDMGNLYGFRVTWFIVINSLQEYSGNAYFGNWPAFNALYALGHDVQSHTVSHHSDDDVRPDAEVIYEYAESQLQIEANIPGNQCVALAYPYDAGRVDIASQYYISARGTAAVPNIANKINYMHVSSGSAGFVAQIDGILTGESSVPYIDERYLRGWGCVHYHLIQDRVAAAADVAYMASFSDQLWMGKYADIARYGQERDSAELIVTTNDVTQIIFTLSDDMLDSIFDYPLTVKVRLYSTWNEVSATQGGQPIEATLITHNGDKYALVKAVPDQGTVVLTPSGAPPANAAPAADAGTDQTITLPAAASLDGTVSDDGLPNPPAAVTATWTKVSGPGTVTFGDANAVDTTASFSTDGAYVLQLEADDSDLTAVDTITITVNPAAGGGTTYTINGSGADQEILSGTSFRWIGQADIRIGRSVSNDAVGVLVFQLPSVATGETVTDAHLDFNFIGGTWSMPAGQLNLYGLGYRSASAVQLGDFFIGAYGTDATDATAIQADFGIAWTGGSPTPVGVYGTDTGGNAALAAYLNAQYGAGAQAGDYVFLRLNPDTFQSADYYWSIASGNSATPPVLTVTINGGAPTNAAPTVDAGSNQAITLPAAASLDGTVSDDGLPNPPGAVTTTWTKVSGAGTVTFGDANAVDTTAGFSTDGVYILQLEADDGDLTATDTVTITVSPAAANAAPTVDAGPDRTIVLGGAADLDGTVTDDGNPSPPAAVATNWTKASGPGTVAFGDVNAVDTTASFSTDGVYVLQLEADDSDLTATDTVTVTVNAASATACDWTGGGDGVSWSDPNNWLEDAVPLTTSDGDTADNVVINGTYDVHVDADVISMRYLTINGGATLTIDPSVTLKLQQIDVISGGLILDAATIDWGRANRGRIYVEADGYIAGSGVIKAKTGSAGVQIRSTRSADFDMRNIELQARYLGGIHTASVDMGRTTGAGWDASNFAIGKVYFSDQRFNHSLFNKDGSIGDSGYALYCLELQFGGDSDETAGLDLQGINVYVRDLLTWGDGSYIDSDSQVAVAVAKDNLIPTTAVYDNDTPQGEVYVAIAGGATNTAPTADAGTNQTITLPAAASLNGTVTDDGLPNPPAAVTTTWSKVSGAGTVTFGDANAVDTTASFSVDGIYVLQLEADDSELTASDTVTVTVDPAPPVNASPTVDAGSDQTITLPAAATLDGTVSDDGLPNPPAAVTATWSKVSGAGTVTFGDAYAVDTTASFSVDGIYVLQLEADDSELSTTNTVTITVDPAGGGGTTYTVNGSGADQEIWNGTSMRWIGQADIRVGRSAGNDAVGVLVFELPTLAAGETVTDAHLDFNFIGGSWSVPAGQLNLYGLGYRAASAVQLGDFFIGAYGTDGTDATTLQADFGITWTGGNPSAMVGVYGTDTAGDAALSTYLNAQYTAGAQTGDYVFLRLNPDTYQTGDYFWSIASGNSGTPPVLTITVEP